MAGGGLGVEMYLRVPPAAGTLHTLTLSTEVGRGRAPSPLKGRALSPSAPDLRVKRFDSKPLSSISERLDNVLISSVIPKGRVDSLKPLILHSFVL